MQSLSLRRKLLLAAPAALLASSLCAGQPQERSSVQPITVEVDPEKEVTEGCVECHMDMHGNPMEIEGKGKRVGQCMSCHQWLHQRPVRIRTQDAKITFRRPAGAFEAGRTYEGQLVMMRGDIYMYPERHMRINPGRSTGLKFVTEKGGRLIFTVFLQGGMTMEEVEATFAPMEFRAGDKTATVGPADIDEVWFKAHGGYASLQDYRRTYSPVDSGPAGGGVKPVAFTDYDVPARFPRSPRRAPAGETGARPPRPAQPRPLGPPEAQPPGQVVFTYNLMKVRPYHFVNRPDGQIVGAGSNQIALWIEDEDGYYVDTVFVTRFAGRKGYRYNLTILPMWRRASRWDLVPRQQADAVSGPTQKPGEKTLIWDCRDWRNMSVEPGTYTYRLEANLMMANRALWSGRIEVGSQQRSTNAALRRIPDDNTARLIVTDVNAAFEPASSQR